MLTGSPDVTEYCVLLPRTLQREPLAVGVTEWCALDCEPGVLKGFKWRIGLFFLFCILVYIDIFGVFTVLSLLPLGCILDRGSNKHLIYSSYTSIKMAPGIGNVVLPTPVYIPTKQASQQGPQQQSSLHHHSLITTDSKALQFHAAASLQLKSGQFQDNNQALPSNDLLITSPYNDPRHLLDLKTLDTANQLLAKALTIFQPIRADYATAPYLDSFNWQAVFDFLRDLAQREEGFHWTRQSFYVVAFRSRLFPDADSERLGELDAYSHQEATTSGGLLKYWFGVKNGNCENLATCELSFTFFNTHVGRSSELTSDRSLA